MLIAVDERQARTAGDIAMSLYLSRNVPDFSPIFPAIRRHGASVLPRPRVKSFWPAVARVGHIDRGVSTLSHGASWAVDSADMSAPRFGARITPYEQLTCGAETRRRALLAIVHSS